MEKDVFEYFYKEDKVTLKNIPIEKKYFDILKKTTCIMGMEKEDINYPISAWGEMFIRKPEDNFLKEELVFKNEKEYIKELDISASLLNDLKKLKEFKELTDNEVVELVVSLEMLYKEKDPNYIILDFDESILS